MTIRLVTKIAAANKDQKYHVFRDWFTGQTLHYHVEHGDIYCRVPVGGDVLATMDRTWEVVDG